ncbi:MAG: hypothetical protein Kow00121_02210 [Elainellaceae cyanobacterium]
MTQTPNFPESRHPLITALNHYSDQDLLTLFQRHPDQGKYFVALFCRYCPLVNTLIQHSVRSPVQANYLLAITWRHIYYELGGLDRQEYASEQQPFSLQSWLINVTAVCINRVELPPVESINYSLRHASPPLWCYLEQALDCLNPLHRLMILMAQTFHWSETRIAAYLQAEGEPMTHKQVKQHLQTAYQELETVLPEDIRAIYLEEIAPPQSSNSHETEDIFSLNPLEPIFE